MKEHGLIADDTEDLPWRDAPADRILPAEQEPAPADVVGWDEDDWAAEPVDVDWPEIPDPSAKYHRDTLEERLAEEEPDVPSTRIAPDSIELLNPEVAGGDVMVAEDDAGFGAEPEELAAEEAAIHGSGSGWPRR